MTDHLPKDFFPRLARDCPDAIIYADATGHIRFWNAAATRLFGFSEDEARGARLDLIIPERLRGRHWQGYDKVIAGTPSRYGEGALLPFRPCTRTGGRSRSSSQSCRCTTTRENCSASPLFCTMRQRASRRCARCAASWRR